MVGFHHVKAVVRDLHLEGMSLSGYLDIISVNPDSLSDGKNK